MSGWEWILVYCAALYDYLKCRVFHRIYHYISKVTYCGETWPTLLHWRCMKCGRSWTKYQEIPHP
jgi:hypothetical protein